MSIEQAEKLKRELTDKYVVVAGDVAELRRFSGLTGLVKTVNMSCRALVEFDGPEDIGWYDIDPAYLSVVDAPVKAKAAKPAAKAESAPAAAKKPAGKKVGGKSPLELARAQGAATGGKKAPTKAKGGLSPLELARQQGAAKSTRTGAPTKDEPTSAEAAKAKPPDKKLSPLELARQQGAAKPAGTDAPAKNEPASAEAAKAKPPDKKLSPLELARQQGAFKGEKTELTAPPETTIAESVAEEKPPSTEARSETETPAEQASKKKDNVPTTGPDGKPLSKIELARLQGPFKG